MTEMTQATTLLSSSFGDDDVHSNQAPKKWESTCGYVTYMDNGIVWKYNSSKTIGLRGILCGACTSASVLRSGSLARGCFLTWILSAACFVLALNIGTAEAKKIDAAHMKELVLDFHQMCTFLLGFFISSCLARWWSIRADGIGGLWGNLDDICMIINALYPSSKETRDQVLRWGILSHELMYMQAIGTEGESELGELVKHGLLLQEELRVIKDLNSKPQVVWAWMCHFFVHLAYGKPENGGSTMPSPATLLPQLLGFACKARDAVGLLFTLTDSQLPFRYVHFLATIVWLHNFFQAIASAIIMEQHLANKDYSGVVTELVFLVTYPMLFLGLLHLGEGMLNPMRSASDVDYPRSAFTYYMRKENEAFFKCTEVDSRAPESSNWRRGLLYERDNKEWTPTWKGKPPERQTAEQTGNF